MECQSMVKSHVGLYDAHCNTRCARFTIGPMLKLYHRPEARLVRLRESCAPTVNSCFLRHSPGAGSPRGPIPSIHPPPQTRRHSVWYSRQRTQQQQRQSQRFASSLRVQERFDAAASQARAARAFPWVAAAAPVAAAVLVPAWRLRRDGQLDFCRPAPPPRPLCPKPPPPALVPVV